VSAYDAIAWNSGAATAPPCRPPFASSITTATTNCGASAGAIPANVAQ
jgi:hypothetical protein